ncbi:MAG: carboxypeptidase regulatory-like domain-containing protein [Chitinophagales bacterium]|nr:carboxypeptidase regulatory-like domain-containing protein [Chitinophagales bacterium]
MNKISWVLIALLTVSFIAQSSAQKARERLGDYYFKRFDFKTALVYYTRAIKKDSGNASLRQKIADSYRLLNNWEEAEKWYALTANDAGLKPENKLYYAEALRSNKKYDEARVFYKAYLDYDNNPSVRNRLNGLDKIRDLAKDKGIYNIELLTINSAASDFGPAFYKEGKIMFCSNRHKSGRGVDRKDSWTSAPFLQIYESENDGSGNIVGAKLMQGKQPNRKFHEGPLCYNKKLDEIYITRSNYIKNRPYSSKDKTVKLKIYRMVYLPDQARWGDEILEAVPFNSKDYSTCHPSLTADGKTLYFASDMPGGYGGVDLYVSHRQIGGEWGVPQNLGPEINTPGDEMFPFIAEDSTLYFASNGHEGLGGLDVFSSSLINGKWSKPENLGYPINTNKDDFGFIIDPSNKYGFFVSNREGGVGDDDIYKFTKKGISINVLVYNSKTKEPLKDARVIIFENGVEKGSRLTDANGYIIIPALPKRNYKFMASKEGFMPETAEAITENKPVSVQIPLQQMASSLNLEVTVIDKKTKEPIPGATVKLVNMNNQQPLRAETDQGGKAFFELEPSSNYRIEAGKEFPGDPNIRYLTVSSTVSTVGKQAPGTLYATLELEKVKKGVAIKIENIYYDLDKWNIRPDAARELDKLVKILLDNPTMQIELSSHTDCRATADYNRILSTKRAEAAVNYIISRGVNKNRLIAAGYGESRLVNKCACEGDVKSDCTEEQHQENRRTEFKILKF